MGLNLEAQRDVRYRLGPDLPADEVHFSLADIIGEFAYDRHKTFRIITFGIDNYSIRHEYPTQAEPTGFSEGIRQPIAISVPQLQRHGERYLALLPSDFNYGLGNAIQMSYTGDAPHSLTFRIGIYNADPTDSQSGGR